jgi:hypothetical protein
MVKVLKMINKNGLCIDNIMSIVLFFLYTYSTDNKIIIFYVNLD